MAASTRLILCAALLAGAALAGAARAQTKPEANAPEVVMFGEWTLRCGVGPTGERACEIGSTIKRAGQKDPVAQIAIGRQIAPAPAAPKDSKETKAAPAAAAKAQTPPPAPQPAAPQPAASAPAAPMKLIILIPVNVMIAPGVEFAGDPAAPPLKLPIKACVQAACIAEAPLTEEEVKAFRGRAQPGRLTFTDPAERPVSVEVSFEGFDKALDTLARR
ncbi:invasion associated locus B family protein [Methylocella sp.]|uniref:invasion associated locus B family protein n=1 Tax=Methylocella sp. TaxID=1978226 RepID=UPI003784832F